MKFRQASTCFLQEYKLPDFPMKQPATNRLLSTLWVKMLCLKKQWKNRIGYYCCTLVLAGSQHNSCRKTT
jgi:hypothetical protein